MSRVRENRMHGSMGGSWKRNKLWQPTKAARGKPRDLSPARPTARHRASSLPDHPLASRMADTAPSCACARFKNRLALYTKTNPRARSPMIRPFSSPRTRVPDVIAYRARTKACS